MTDTVSCAKCGAHIGTYTTHEGRIWLRIGQVEVFSAHGACNCGAPWHWNSTDKLMEELIERRRLLAELKP